MQRTHVLPFVNIVFFLFSFFFLYPLFNFKNFHLYVRMFKFTQGQRHLNPLFICYILSLFIITSLIKIYINGLELKANDVKQTFCSISICSLIVISLNEMKYMLFLLYEGRMKKKRKEKRIRKCYWLIKIDNIIDPNDKNGNFDYIILQVDIIVSGKNSSCFVGYNHANGDKKMRLKLLCQARFIESKSRINSKSKRL